MPNQPSIEQAAMLFHKEFTAGTYSDYMPVLRVFPMAKKRANGFKSILWKNLLWAAARKW